MAVTTQSGDLPEIARTAEALGSESLWVPEHPVIPVVMTRRFLPQLTVSFPSTTRAGLIYS
jgi:alkanesulfonate monooxygenase SsuD/methylene tetrahydromethanopterin reductase-like flavin-dependent oxidoreductase (luciferase family)